MTGWVETWNYYAREAERVRALHPDCTEARDCPAREHILNCRRWRRHFHNWHIASLFADGLAAEGFIGGGVTP